jgi:D-alanyl-lipoteichoic acid acyltransferase DltB (MBOAT superfamily)
MAFNSLAFALFLPIVFALYWLLPRKALRQNLLLLVASYWFYAWWSYKFLLLLVASSTITYLLARRLEKTELGAGRRMLLWTSLAVNLGVLVLFKYLGFFGNSFIALLKTFGLHADPLTLKLILPLGLSYYTFQMAGYTIDVYRKQVPAVGNLITFLLFTGFFPKIVAGPIERASHLVPQLQNDRGFQMEQAKDGLRQMLWGFFKKVVIADNLAAHVNYIYGNYSNLDGATIFVGTFLFAIQIYCDFSGYSDIAIGTAHLFGIDLMQNFASPYFARDIAEFWRRWHISLSTWFRDYVFFPLGSLRKGKLIAVRNIVITFTLSGLWHGAAWTYVGWGSLHGIYFIPQMIKGPRRQTAQIAQGRLLPNLTELRRMLVTFLLVMFGWVFFRADSLRQATGLLTQMVRRPWVGISHGTYLPVLAVCGGLLAWEWWQRARPHALDIARLPALVRWATYYFIVILIFWYGVTSNVPFIYVKF